MKPRGHIAISVTMLIAALSVTALDITYKRTRVQADETRIAMGDVDVWSGLNAPVKAEKPGPRDAAKLCLALNAYHEARGESFEGQIAVNQVALRRAGLEYQRVCKEIYKPGQFSWTEEKVNKPTGAAWQWALAAAEESLQWAAYPDKHIDYSNKATYFHAHYVNPYWVRGLELVTIVNGHKFYR